MGGAEKKGNRMEDPSKKSGLFFWLLIGAAVIAGAYFFRGGAQEGTFRSYAKGRFPSLASEGHWFNSDTPVTWDSLAGQVVWLEFSFLH
jgi:hypothetical protein